MENRTTIQVSEKLRKELRILSSKRDISYQELLNDMITVFKELDKERTIVSIPAMLSKKIEEHIKGTDIKTVSEYVTFMLRLILSEKDSGVSNSDENRIKKKLKRLGYL